MSDATSVSPHNAVGYGIERKSRGEEVPRLEGALEPLKKKRVYWAVAILLAVISAGTVWIDSGKPVLSLFGEHSWPKPDKSGLPDPIVVGLVMEDDERIDGVGSFKTDLIKAIGKETGLDFNVEWMKGDRTPERGKRFLKTREWDGVRIDVVSSGCGGEVVTFPYFNELWAGDDYEGSPYCFHVLNGDDEIRKALNYGLAEIVTNGTYDRIYSRHFDRDDYKVEWCGEHQRTVTKDAERPAPCKQFTYHIYSDYLLRFDRKSGRVTGVVVRSRLAPYGETEGDWEFEAAGGGREEEAESGDGQAVLPLTAPGVEYRIQLRFDGEVDGHGEEVEEESRVRIPDVDLRVRREDGKITVIPSIGVTNGGGRWLIAVADRDGRIIRYHESKQWRDPRLRADFDLKDGEYRIGAVFYGKILLVDSSRYVQKLAIQKTQRLSIKGNRAEISAIPGETARFLSFDGGKDLAERMKAKGVLP
jgi:hypothetical protein